MKGKKRLRLWNRAATAAGFWLVLAACGGSESGGPDASTSDATPTGCEALQAAIQQFADENVPYAGISVGVETPECGILTASAGLANMDPETPMTPEHLVPGSPLAGAFLGTVVLQLVDEGELDLEDPLSTWKPDIANADSITVRSLLNHTSGLRTYLVDPCWTEARQDKEHEWTIDELLACADLESTQFEPGEDFTYSHTDMVLLGYIVETLTGNPLHEEIRSRVLTPLGLESTFTLWYEDPPGEMARSYSQPPGGALTDVTEFYNYSFMYACANMASNIGDLVRAGKALSTGATLQSATHDQRLVWVDQDEQTWTTDELYEYGFGLSLVPAHEEHSGDVVGLAGTMKTGIGEWWYSPSWDCTVALQFNRDYVTNEAYKWFYPKASELFGILGEYR